jgi:alpha-1,2-glucosyltransferase
LIIFAFFLIYIFTFKIDHPYNINQYFLRNKLLVYFTSSIILKILFFIPVAYSILSISVTELYEKSFYLIYPFTILYLIPSWLIEQRYYLIPFALFILFKKEESKLVEYLSIVFYIISSALLFYGIRNELFFI